MFNRACFSENTPAFQGIELPEDGYIVGYGAIIAQLKLPVPRPQPISLVSIKHTQARTKDWTIFPKSYLPKEHEEISEIAALHKQLVFALKYEGVNLLVFSFLVKHYSLTDLTSLVNIEPTGQYSRRVWFLVEWLLGKELPGKSPISKKSYVPVLDTKHQYAVDGTKSSRHLVINNLPGTPNFCPLIQKTPKLEAYIKQGLSNKSARYLKDLRKDILLRASAFLLLKDSKASFSIEGESPKSKRAMRWGRAIGQAGSKTLNRDEFVRLQQVIIENTRFVETGFRKKGGFVGEHDRATFEPIPDHISARWQDLDSLIEGLVQTNTLLINSDLDAVLIATSIAFGFVFIHPFEDGNGRIHRYLIHHVLAKKRFAQQGIVFPVSSSILDHIDDYRQVLEHYSHGILQFIDWAKTPDNNVEILNETVEYYRYFDATEQAEFLYDCVFDTIDRIIPAEVQYLTRYDAFRRYLDENWEMPDKLIALLVHFLEQNSGKLSERAMKKEFSELTPNEQASIEETYQWIFMD